MSANGCHNAHICDDIIAFCLEKCILYNNYLFLNEKMLNFAA